MCQAYTSISPKSEKHTTVFAPKTKNGFRCSRSAALDSEKAHFRLKIPIFCLKVPPKHEETPFAIVDKRRFFFVFVQ